jgi:hypothetical protein
MRNSPLQHIVELPRAKRINLMGIGCPMIAVEDYADMARRRLGANLTVKSDFV